VAHIHDKIDFTVAVFVVAGDRVLLIHHRKLDRWLPLGGHIELDEDPEQAALREAAEESGLEVELMGERPPTTGGGTRALIAPRFLDIHRITSTHEHIGLIYWARPRGGALLESSPEHRAIRWCAAAELDALEPPISAAVRWYCLQALQELGERPRSAADTPPVPAPEPSALEPAARG
jgi:8-oxo-dGTP pyrophosphatase MutT (NUDIX family)